MCLGIPGEVVAIRDDGFRMGTVRFGTVEREVCLEYVPEAALGEYVIVHAGFAIAMLQVKEANRALELLSELKGHASEEP